MSMALLFPMLYATYFPAILKKCSSLLLDARFDFTLEEDLKGTTVCDHVI